MRVFGKPARRRQLREQIMEEGLDGIGTQETIKESFTQRELSEISGGSQFTWIWKSAKGHSGGILMGLKKDRYEVEETEVGEYYVSMVIRNRMSNVRWVLITVYGPAQHNLSTDFISELSRKCMGTTLPMMMGVISTLSGELRIKIMII
jgi:hypothetical protein